MPSLKPVVDSDCLTFTAAAKISPGRPHAGTVYRWHSRGVSGIKLQTIRIGGRRYTNRAWLEEFFEAVTRASDASVNPHDKLADKREAEIRAAEDDLSAAGF